MRGKAWLDLYWMCVFWIFQTFDLNLNNIEADSRLIFIPSLSSIDVSSEPVSRLCFLSVSRWNRISVNRQDHRYRSILPPSLLCTVTKALMYLTGWMWGCVNRMWGVSHRDAHVPRGEGIYLRPCLGVWYFSPVSLAPSCRHLMVSVRTYLQIFVYRC